MDFRDLRSELLEEYYFWADKPSDVFYKFQPYYWMVRGEAFVAAATNLPGTKYLVSSNATEGLTDEVRKALLFADHVVVRHERFIPHRAQIFVGHRFAWPGSDSVRWVEENHAEANGSPLLPCEPGSADAVTARAFLDWTTGAGRPWVEAGLVTYVPCVIPRDASIALLSQGTNVVSGYRKLGVLPDDGRAVDERAAAAVTELRLPYLSGISPEQLRALMSECPDAFLRLRQTLLRLIDSAKEDVGTEDFSRRMDVISADVAAGTAELEARLKRLSIVSRWDRIEVELLALGASALWYAGSTSAAAIAAVTAAGVAGAKAMKERFKGADSLRDAPYFALAKLGKVVGRHSSARTPWRTARTPADTKQAALPDRSPATDSEEPWAVVPPDPPPSWGSISGEGMSGTAWILCSPAFPPNDSLDLLGNWERARQLKADNAGPGSGGEGVETRGTSTSTASEE